MIGQLPYSVCHIKAENTGTLDFFGTLLATAFVLSLVTGKAYYRRVIAKDEEPVMYWFVVAVYGILGGMGLIGPLVCPIR